MPSERIVLLDPTVELEDAYRSMVDDYAGTEEKRFRRTPEDFAAFVGRLADQAAGVGIENGQVPWNTYWLVRGACRGAGATILGTSRLRQRLNDHLLITGGHIGYDIRPSQRGKGYGRGILALTLEKARAMGIDRAMVNCTGSNVASARIIEANGGVLMDEIHSEPMGGMLRRYWIELSRK